MEFPYGSAGELSGIATAVTWVATEPWVRFLAQELPHVEGVAKKKWKEKKERKRSLYQIRCLLFAPPHSSNTWFLGEVPEEFKKRKRVEDRVFIHCFPSREQLPWLAIFCKDQCSSEGGLLNGTLLFWLLALSFNIISSIISSIPYIKLSYTHTHTHTHTHTNYPRLIKLRMPSFSCWSSESHILQSHY